MAYGQNAPSCDPLDYGDLKKKVLPLFKQPVDLKYSTLWYDLARNTIILKDL